MLAIELRDQKLAEGAGDALPVGAFPEELVAAGAFEKVVEPFVGAGRDAVAGVFFIDLDELAAATHAAGLVGGRKVEFGAEVTELLMDGEGGRNPEGADLAADDGAAIEEHALKKTSHKGTKAQRKKERFRQGSRDDEDGDWHRDGAGTRRRGRPRYMR